MIALFAAATFDKTVAGGLLALGILVVLLGIYYGLLGGEDAYHHKN